MRILIVEDHEQLASLTAKAFIDRDFVVDTAASLEEASAASEGTTYDAMLVDRVLPDGDGLAWLRSRRGRGCATPAVVLSATKHHVQDRIEGLQGGADDYLVKPVHVDELIARVHALLRRAPGIRSPALEAANISLDLDSREVTVGGRRAALRRRESLLLECLMRRVGRVVTRATLEESLYGFDDDSTANAIEVCVHRLRGFLTETGATARVHTVRGVGYMMETF